MRPRHYLIAIPPESAHDDMTRLKRVGGGLYFQGDGRNGDDYFCGRCGRILALSIPQSQILNIWLDCPKCGWLNGFDVDLGWAKYALKELQERKLSLERVAALLAELREWEGTADEFVARNPDISAGPLSWFAKISLGTLLTILTLLYAVYSGQQAEHTAEEALHVAQEQVAIEKQAAQSALTPQEVQRLAADLHRLQQEIRPKPPPRTARGQGKR